MSAQLVLPGWLVQHPDFTEERRAWAETTVKEWAIARTLYDGSEETVEGQVEWIEHPGMYGAPSFWEVRAW